MMPDGRFLFGVGVGITTVVRDLELIYVHYRVSDGDLRKRQALETAYNYRLSQLLLMPEHEAPPLVKNFYRCLYEDKIRGTPGVFDGM